MKIPAYQERENLTVFSQEGGTSECILEANSLYESTSITFRPEFLGKLKTAYSGDLDVIINKMESTKPTIFPPINWLNPYRMANKVFGSVTELNIKFVKQLLAAGFIGKSMRKFIEPTSFEILATKSNIVLIFSNYKVHILETRSAHLLIKYNHFICHKCIPSYL